MKPRPQTAWRELGYPAHFIAAASCRYKRATVVGDYIVSSVGDMRVRSGDKPETIGCGRLFETMVFRKGEVCDCGCNEPLIDSGDYIDFAAANTAAECTQNHERLCEKHSALTPAKPAKKQKGKARK